MAQTIRNRIRFHVGGHFVEEAFVGERVLQARWRPQRSGEERRLHGVREHALAGDDPGASGFAAGTACDVRRCSVRAVAKFTRWLARSPRRERLRREPGERPGDDVARRVVAGPAAARREPRFVVPRGDAAGRVDTDALIDRVREPVVLPRHLVFARQLHPDRFPDALRQQRRVVRHGVGAVDAVTAGAARIDDADVVGRNAEDHRDAAARRVRRLRRREDRRLVALHVGDGARRAHGSVHLVRMQVRRFDDRRRAAERLIDVAGVHEERVARRLLAQVVMEARLRRKRRARRPRGLERPRGLHRLPRLLADDADEILVGDDLDESRHAAHRGFVNAAERRADCRRAHDRAVDHAGHTHVVHELELSCRHRRHVEPRHGRAEHLPFARRLARRRCVHRHVECSSGDEIAVGRALRAIRRDVDRSIGDGELIRRRAELVDGDAEAFRREPEQRLSSRRAGLREIALVEVGRRRLAPRRRSLIGRDGGVALNQADARDRDRQFLGD